MLRTPLEEGHGGSFSSSFGTLFPRVCIGLLFSRKGMDSFPSDGLTGMVRRLSILEDNIFLGRKRRNGPFRGPEKDPETVSLSTQGGYIKKPKNVTYDFMFWDISLNTPEIFMFLSPGSETI
ncbi:MAG: hypothetical protein L7U59_09140 [Flavobacteriaceae bacterium]|nr:hypothetical protein [Flavobacteriaceae bacterium]